MQRAMSGCGKCRLPLRSEHVKLNGKNVSGEEKENKIDWKQASNDVTVRRHHDEGEKCFSAPLEEFHKSSVALTIESQLM